MKAVFEIQLYVPLNINGTDRPRDDEWNVIWNKTANRTLYYTIYTQNCETC